MLVGPIFTEGIDQYLFEEILDPLLPGAGLPIPLPVRAAAYAVELQVEAGQAIAEGKVAGKNQYIGQAAVQDRAGVLGFNLIYQPGGIQI
jgi:hypothetical protein